MNKAVFLDRDGVLNNDPGFLHKLKDLRFYPGIVEALIKLSKTSYYIIIVTNQPGIARGSYTEEKYKKFEEDYLTKLKRMSNAKIKIDKVYYCPHHPTEGIGKYKLNCPCRKPKSGMLLQAKKDFNLDLRSSFLIGDKRSDIKAGRRVGCTTILVKTGERGFGGEGCIVAPDFITKDLNSAVDRIINATTQ